MHSLINRVLEHLAGNYQPPAAASARGLKQEDIHEAGIQCSCKTPSSSSPCSRLGSSQSAIFSPSAATLQATALRPPCSTCETTQRLDSLLPTLQHNPPLQFNLVLQNSRALITMPGSAAPLCQPDAEAFLDTATGFPCEKEAHPVGEREACKQVTGSRTAFTQFPEAVQALLLGDLQERQLRQHHDSQLGSKSTALTSPDCQMTTTALTPMHSGAPADTISHLQSPSSPAPAAPELYDHSMVSAVVQRPALGCQPKPAVQERVPAFHRFSRPEDIPSLLPHQLSTLDAHVLVSELSASASLSKLASMPAKHHDSHMTDSPVAAVKAGLDCSVGRLKNLSNQVFSNSILWAAMCMYPGLLVGILLCSS